MPECGINLRWQRMIMLLTILRFKRKFVSQGFIFPTTSFSRQKCRMPIDIPFQISAPILIAPLCSESSNHDYSDNNTIHTQEKGNEDESFASRRNALFSDLFEEPSSMSTEETEFNESPVVASNVFGTDYDDEYEQQSSFVQKSDEYIQTFNDDVDSAISTSTSETKRTGPQFMTGNISASKMEFLAQASNGYGSSTSYIDDLENQLAQVQSDIYELNNGETFNVNSPKQVAITLFGKNSESTNKDALEALAGAGNKIAEKVLAYRKLKSDIRRMKQKQDNINYIKKEKELEKNQNKRKIPRDPLLLVDASAYIFRAYYSMPPLHRQDGTPVGAVLGVCNMINRLILQRCLQGERPRLALVFDGVQNKKSFRHELFEDYKANRPPCPVDLVPQFDLVKQATKAYGIPCLEVECYEADDVIATIGTEALESGIDVNILSSDKDLMQLVTSPTSSSSVEKVSLQMVDPMKMGKVVQYKDVIEKWGVPPGKLGDVLALAGDSSDNIPGVPGIGPKIAATLINEYGSLEELLGNLESIKQKGRREKLMENIDMVRKHDFVQLHYFCASLSL